MQLGKVGVGGMGHNYILFNFITVYKYISLYLNFYQKYTNLYILGKPSGKPLHEINDQTYFKLTSQ